MQQLFTSKNFKYGLIILGAIASSAIAYSFIPFHWLLVEVAKTIFKFHARWMAYNHSLFSWFASAIYLFSLGIGGLVVPFILLAVYVTSFYPQWLPDKTPYLTGLKIVNYWGIFVLFAFAITLLAQTLETLRIL